MIKLPGESRYITVDGIRIHYVVAGEGRPVMLIHGLGASVVTWRDNIAALSQSHRVYAIDLPGHGDSAKPDIGYEPDAIVECIGKLVDELGIERPAIIGNSVGGALAMMFAFRFPDLVSGLVLVGSAGLGREISLYIRLLSVPLIGTVLETFKIGGPKLMLANVFHDRSLATEELANELYRSRKMPGAREAVMRVIRNTVSIGG
ncbi:MAG: alpha/beta fold hydrolase, partial [Chloroflexi bacterium]|nr:alpha/beta fold hydrolase [Chloroflexota bacterium]